MTEPADVAPRPVPLVVMGVFVVPPLDAAADNNAADTTVDD